MSKKRGNVQIRLTEFSARPAGVIIPPKLKMPEVPFPIDLKSFQFFSLKQDLKELDAAKRCVGTSTRPT